MLTHMHYTMVVLVNSDSCFLRKHLIKEHMHMMLVTLVKCELNSKTLISIKN